jgi:rare lipoprotein A (peptidoglycan hydrolase)
MMVTALRTDLAENYAAKYGTSACSKCVRVNANGKSVVARIIDNSNDYSNNGGKRYLDLSQQAFEKLDSIDKGTIPVEFEIIACP